MRYGSERYLSTSSTLLLTTCYHHASFIHLAPVETVDKQNSTKASIENSSFLFASFSFEKQTWALGSDRTIERTFERTSDRQNERQNERQDERTSTTATTTTTADECPMSI